MTASGQPRSFPRFTWVRCECGCGWEGEDEVAQWLIEEAVLLKHRAQGQQDELSAVERAGRSDRLHEMALRALKGF